MKCIKHFLDSHNGFRLLIDSFPNHSVCAFAQFLQNLIFSQNVRFHFFCHFRYYIVKINTFIVNHISKSNSRIILYANQKEVLFKWGLIYLYYNSLTIFKPFLSFSLEVGDTLLVFLVPCLIYFLEGFATLIHVVLALSFAHVGRTYRHEILSKV